MAKNYSDESPIIRLGISACLLGQPVRHDGGHKREAFLVDTLGAFVKWVPVCPEVEIGMGTPRETIRLEGNVDDPRLIATKSGVDHTNAMKRWSKQRLKALDELDLHGFVLKRASPSCGAFRVKVHPGNSGTPLDRGQGVFARALTQQCPLLPVEEEGRLNDVGLRENFIERVFAWHRWQQFLADKPTKKGLVAFHTAHKMTLMSHSVEAYRALGRLVASVGKRPWASVRAGYAEGFMTTLARRPTRCKHTRVLDHLVGSLKRLIDADARQELIGLIEDYHRELVPLIVPLTLLKHHVATQDVPEWLHQQLYLNPCPKELRLRNQL